MNRLFQFLLGIDQLVNVFISLFIGGGWADESLSARAYRSKENKYWLLAYKVINKIFFWQRNHCEEAYVSERDQMQLPPRYRIK